LPHAGSSVPDPGCLIRIPDPDFFYPSRIPDPKASTQERGEKKIVVIPFFVVENYLFLKCLRKKNLPSFQRIIELLPKNLSLSSKRHGFGIRDPRSGIRNKPVPDPGSMSWGQKGTGSRIRILNTGWNTTVSSDASGPVTVYLYTRPRLFVPLHT
jgi:hypothetical protein